MKSFTISANALLTELDFVGKVVDNNHILPILSGVLFKDRNIIATNMENFIVGSTGATDFGDGFVANYRQLRKIVALLKGLDLKLEVQSGLLLINAHGKLFTMEAEDAKDFPPLPEIERGKEFLISNEQLRELPRAIKFLSKDQMRPAMTGVYFSNKKDMVATDGSIMFVSRNSGAGRYLRPDKQFILGRTACEILADAYRSGIIWDDGVVANFTPGKAKIEVDLNRYIVTRLIDERYPEWEKAWTYGTQVVVLTIDKKHLTQAVAAADLVQDGNAAVLFKVNPLKHKKHIQIGAAYINSTNNKVCKFHEDVPVLYQRTYYNTPVYMRFSCALLLKALANINDKEIGITVLMKEPFRKGEPYLLKKPAIINDEILIMPTIILEETFNTGEKELFK